jgi:DnaJ-class molecular chaperone
MNKEELKSKFRSLMMKYHPDKAGDTKENNEKCKNIILEYEKQLKKLKK